MMAERPRSMTVEWINWTGVAGLLGVAWLMRQFPQVDPLLATLLAAAGFALPVIALEAIFLRGDPRRKAGLDHARPPDHNLARVVVKLIGLWTTLALVGFSYAVFPEYRQALFAPFWDALRYAIPAFLLISPAYFYWLDARMEEPRDGYWHLGALVLGWSETVDLGRIKQHALGWAVKGFFLPLMFSYFHGNLNHIRHTDFALLDFMGWYRLLYDLLILVDVGCIVVGYALTVRLFDSHIRSTEPTWGGWIPTLICYQPFWGLVGPQYFAYRTDMDWGRMFEGHPALQAAFAAIILGLMAIYTWASVSFGLRFSNLTHRGIITNGPYRWCKHPAYVSKNLSWWFEALPFLAPFVMGMRGGVWNGYWMDALGRTLRLLGVNLIYYIRARTEERHLSQDPDYVRYALWMEKHGLLRWVSRLFRWTRYAPPRWFWEARERALRARKSDQE